MSEDSEGKAEREWWRFVEEVLADRSASLFFLSLSLFSFKNNSNTDTRLEANSLYSLRSVPLLTHPHSGTSQITGTHAAAQAMPPPPAESSLADPWGLDLQAECASRNPCCSFVQVAYGDAPMYLKYRTQYLDSGLTQHYKIADLHYNGISYQLTE